MGKGLNHYILRVIAEVARSGDRDARQIIATAISRKRDEDKNEQFEIDEAEIDNWIDHILSE